MKVENRQFLDLNRSHHHTLVVAGFLTNLTNEVRQTMLNIIREEFSPGYLCCLHCSADIAQMIKYLYGQYDQLLMREAEAPLIAPPIAPLKPKRNEKSTKKRTKNS
jgi:hypothetical protein